jgi:hypothetical protein
MNTWLIIPRLNMPVLQDKVAWINTSNNRVTVRSYYSEELFDATSFPGDKIARAVGYCHHNGLTILNHDEMLEARKPIVP